jgi:hypothetical protein
MRLYSYPDLSFLTSRATASQSAGPNTITWDGTTTAGMLASDGGYFCTLEASNGVGQTGTFNSAASPILLQGVGSFPVWTVPGVLGTAGFDPYRNDLVQLSYMVDRPMVSTLQIHATDGGSPINSFRDLITGEVRAPGVLYTEFWAGRRDDGTIHNGAFFPYFGIPEKFPVHGVVVDVPEPEFQDFRAEAYVIQNGYREVSTFTYTLTRNATVSITITDPNGNLVRTLLSASPQTAGFQSVEWDGTNDLGVLVDVEGDYRIDLSATDAILPRATTRRGTVVVYR